MLNFIKNISTVASSDSVQTAVNLCARAVAVVRPSSDSVKVEVFSSSKLNTLTKCDDSYRFSIYKDKASKPTYFVLYVPRLLGIWHSQNHEEAISLQKCMNNLNDLISALEMINSKSFSSQIEYLVRSVRSNPLFADIHHASACGFAEVIERLCMGKAPDVVLNRVSDDGRLPLQIAVERGHKEAVKILVRLGASVSKQDSHLKNALHYAAGGDSEVLKMLLSENKSSAAVDAFDEDGLSPLCSAIILSRADCAELLLKTGCSTGPFPGGSLAALLTITVATPDLARIVDLLMEFAPYFLMEHISGTSTVLHEKLDPALIFYIIDHYGSRINVNARNGLGQTPVYCAVERNDVSQAVILIAGGADVDIADNELNTPLHIASKNGSEKMVKLLLCFNAAVDKQNNQGLTALSLAPNKTIRECLALYLKPPKTTAPAFEDALNNVMQERALASRKKLKDDGTQLLNLLALDGGGIKGVILVQTLLHIEHRLKSPLMEHFHWLAGTSTGAILALGLARGDSLKKCQGFYFHLKDRLFVGNRPYCESPIEEFLQTTFGDFLTMGHIEIKKVMVTATSVKQNPPKLILFRNYRLPVGKAGNAALGYGDPYKTLVWKCARYSSAAPTFFPPKDDLVDGGLMSNNPTLDLLADIHTYNAASVMMGLPTLKLGCVLSLGTGQQPVQYMSGAKFSFGVPQGIMEGCAMIKDLFKMKDILVEQITASNGECVKRARSWAHDQSIPFFRFSPPLSKNVELDERNDDVIIDCLWETEKYLRTIGEHDVNMLVNYLKWYLP